MNVGTRRDYAAHVDAPPGKQNSFSRGLDVLIAIAMNGQMSVAEVAEELRLPTSTAYRYVRSLRDYALIEEAQGTYVPGWRLMELSGQHLTHTRVAELGAEHLRTLTYQTEETAVITIRAGSHAICLRQTVSPRPDPYAFRINELLPLYAGASSRVLLAYAPRPILELILATMIPYSPNTPTPERLLELVNRTRHDGYTISRGEFQAGALSIAAPVFAEGEVACSLSLAGPGYRCDNAPWRRRALRLLRKAGAELGEELSA